MNSLIRGFLSIAKRSIFISIAATTFPSYGADNTKQTETTNTPKSVILIESTTSIPSESILNPINNSSILVGERTSETILISNESSGKTIIQNAILSREKITQEKLHILQEKFEISIKNGAKLFWDIVNEPNNLEVLIQKTSHEQVMELLIYFYYLGSKVRSDQTCPAECIIKIFEKDNKYFSSVYNFLLGYESNYKKQKELSNKNIWKKEPIAPASTPGAHRYNYVVNPTQEKRDQAAMRFRDFHVTIHSTNEKFIEIKPEVYGKLTLVGTLKNITNTIKDTDNTCNTQYVPKNLVKIFTDIHNELKIKYSPEEIKSLGAMYKKLLELTPKENDDNERKKIRTAVKTFKKEAAKENLGHLNVRVGKEIILGAEELLFAYFSEPNHKNKLNEKDGVNLSKIFYAFTNLKTAINTFINIENPSMSEEQKVMKVITDFYELICGPNNVRAAIEDKFINDYLLSTAFLLKNIVLKVHPPLIEKESENLLQNTVLPQPTARKLQKLFFKPLFEESYQRTKFTVQQAKEAINRELLQAEIEATIGMYCKTYEEKLNNLTPEKLPNSPQKIPGNFNVMKQKCHDLYSMYQKARINCLRTKKDLAKYPVAKKLEALVPLLVNATVFTYKKNESAWKNCGKLFTEMFENLRETKLTLAKNAENYGFYSLLNPKYENFLTSEWEKFKKNKGMHKRWLQRSLGTRIKLYPSTDLMFSAARKVFENKANMIEKLEK